MQVTVGDSKSKVLSIMGNPGNRQFSGTNEAWQYCQTDIWGMSGDDYIVVWFRNGNVSAVTSYKNTNYGDCSMFYREIDW